MARLYSNENFPLQVTLKLRALGHDVLTVAEAGNAGQAITDEAVLKFATSQNRAILTLDRRDFIKLHEEVPDHAGIIVCTQDNDLIGQTERIHQAITAAEPLHGKLIRVNRPPNP